MTTGAMLEPEAVVASWGAELVLTEIGLVAVATVS